jgi:tripartite-type tricarboxylate transporter receptor subunit TctC
LRPIPLVLKAAFLAAAMLLGNIPGIASAQGYPHSPIKFVVPYAAGGSTDILARTLGDFMSKRLGQSVVVINQPGGGGAIGTTAVARAPADGYTILMATNGTHAINPSLMPNLTYDAVKDFQPVSLVATVPLLLVVPSKSDVRTIRQLVDQPSRKSAALNFGSAGIGSSGHLAGEMLKLEGKLDASHTPYKGDAPAVVDLMAGHIDYLFANMPAAVSQVRAGAIRALAVTTAQRSNELPDVPTVREAGFPRLQVDPWYGIFLPAGTTPEVTAKLSEAVNAALQDPGVRKKMEGLGATPQGTTPEKFAQVISADITKFAAIVKTSGAKVD